MPTIHSLELPLPKNCQDFEAIVCDAQAQRWKSTTLQKNGRSGQRQDGIDIYGPDDIGRPVGIQCKRSKSPLQLKHVTEEISKAENFSGQLTTLFIATTSDYDAQLQQHVRLLSDRRVAQGKFAVGVLFWNDIVSGLLLNSAVFQAHYPQIQLANVDVEDKERLIAALELGYHGSDLWAYIILVYGEFGEMAQSDPDEVIANLRIVERRAQQLLSPADVAPILESLSEVRYGCLSPKTSKSDWNPVELHAKRIASRLRQASSLLSLREANVLDLALQLGRIYFHVDKLPAISVRSSIELKVRNILPTTSADAITKKLASAKKLRSGRDWAQRVFSLLNHEIRF